MIRTIATAALVLAGGAFVLTWLEVQKATRVIAPDVYVAIVAALSPSAGSGWGGRLRRVGTGPISSATRRPFDHWV